MSSDTPTTTARDRLNEKTPEGADSHSLTLNTLDYSIILDTLKDHALKLVANAHSEMSEEQWCEWTNEHTATYAKALTDLFTTELAAIQSELDKCAPEKWILPHTSVDVLDRDASTWYFKAKGHDAAIDQYKANINQVFEQHGGKI